MKYIIKFKVPVASSSLPQALSTFLITYWHQHFTPSDLGPTVNSGRNIFMLLTAYSHLLKHTIGEAVAMVMFNFSQNLPFLQN